MTTEELEQLRIKGMLGLDLSPGDEISLLAYDYIFELKQHIAELKTLLREVGK